MRLCEFYFGNCDYKLLLRITQLNFIVIGGAKLQGFSSATGSVITTKQSQPIFLKSEGGVLQQKFNTSQISTYPKIRQQPLSPGKTVKIVRLNPNLAAGKTQTLSATMIPSPLKKGIVSIAPKIIKTDTSEVTNIMSASTKLEEGENDSSAETTDSVDPKAALKRKLKEIEAMNEELRRRKEEADELKRQLEECKD